MDATVPPTHIIDATHYGRVMLESGPTVTPAPQSFIKVTW